MGQWSNLTRLYLSNWGGAKPPTWKVRLDQPFAWQWRMQRRLWPASRMRRFAAAKLNDLRLVYHLGLGFLLTKCDPKATREVVEVCGPTGGSDEEPTQCLHLWEDQDAERIRGEFWVLSWDWQKVFDFFLHLRLTCVSWPLILSTWSEFDLLDLVQVGAKRLEQRKEKWWPTCLHILGQKGEVHKPLTQVPTGLPGTIKHTRAWTCTRSRMRSTNKREEIKNRWVQHLALLRSLGSPILFQKFKLRRHGIEDSSNMNDFNFLSSRKFTNQNTRITRDFGGSCRYRCWESQARYAQQHEPWAAGMKEMLVTFGCF